MILVTFISPEGLMELLLDPGHREGQHEDEEDEEEDDAAECGRENVQLGLEVQHAGLSGIKFYSFHTIS